MFQEAFEHVTMAPVPSPMKVMVFASPGGNIFNVGAFIRFRCAKMLFLSHTCKFPDGNFFLHVEKSVGDNGVSGQQVLDLLVLEDDVFQRCLCAQPAPTARQRSNRSKYAHFLRDLAATADSALFSQQLLNMTHRWWSEADGARYPDPATFQLPHRPSHDARCYF